MRWIAVPTTLLAAAAFAAPPAAAQVVNPTVPAERDTTPIVLSGKELGSWAVPANQTVQPPLMDLLACPYTVNQDELTDDEPWGNGGDNTTEAFEQDCPESYDPHNHYADPAVDTADSGAHPTGPAVDRLLGYRWDEADKRFEQIPFQVDEQFTRYLDNTASGFAIYSGQDQHTTYAYPREGFRYTEDGPESDPCTAQPATPAAGDPVAGLDQNDEIAFMYADAGPQAPEGAKLPKGIERSQVITVTDPTNPDAGQRYVYVAQAAADGPKPAFDASNGYVKYERDANAGTFEFSESSYENYGNAEPGYYCDAEGNIVRNEDGTPKVGRRRPRDTATITTDRYRFRYDGRWLMTKVEISKDGGETYGPDLVDRWKARAFQQDPSSKTPCCGYEEEDNNWGGSSTLLGEKVGPVRAIRETWGADSGTNVIRRETFYRDEMKQKTWLRVHVIPPLDGIYAQWDFNAGRVDTFYNARGEYKVDGKNDEVYGNFDDPCNPVYGPDAERGDDSEIDQGYRSLYETMGLCEGPWGEEMHVSLDLPDLTHGDPNSGTAWSMVAGDDGSILDRITIDTGTTPGGAAQSVAAVPYYRDDACFDDGTGSNPGPRLNKRASTEIMTHEGSPRVCWDPAKHEAIPNDDAKYFQGSIATHGLHLLFLAESDNARQTVPLNEIVSEWQMVMLPGRQDASAGEKYGRAFEKPLVTVARELGGPEGGAEEPGPEPCPEGQVRGEDGQCHTPEPQPEPCPEGQVRDDKGKCKKPKGDNTPPSKRSAESAPAPAAAASAPAAQPSHVAAPRSAPQPAQRSASRRAAARRVAAAKRRCAKVKRAAKTRSAKRKAARTCAAAQRRARRGR